MISRIKRLPLREVWKHEALYFIRNDDVPDDVQSVEIQEIEGKLSQLQNAG